MGSCVNCEDVLTRSDTKVYAAKCGHLFHLHCLTERINRSETCPHCYSALSKSNAFQIFLNDAYLSEDSDPALTKTKEVDLQIQLESHKNEIIALTEAKSEAENQCTAIRDELRTMRIRKSRVDKGIYKLNEEIKRIKRYLKMLEHHRIENEKLKNQLAAYNLIQTILEGTEDEQMCALENTSLDTKLVKRYLYHCKKQLQGTVKQLEDEIKLTNSHIRFHNGYYTNQSLKLEDVKQKYKTLKHVLKLNETKDVNDCNTVSESEASSGKNDVDSGHKHSEEVIGKGILRDISKTCSQQNLQCISDYLPPTSVLTERNPISETRFASLLTHPSNSAIKTPKTIFTGDMSVPYENKRDEQNLECLISCHATVNVSKPSLQSNSTSSLKSLFKKSKEEVKRKSSFNVNNCLPTLKKNDAKKRLKRSNDSCATSGQQVIQKYFKTLSE